MGANVVTVIQEQTKIKCVRDTGSVSTSEREQKVQGEKMVEKNKKD